MASKTTNTENGCSNFRLVALALAVSFGTWFPIGYSMGIINGAQWTMIHWIRHVKCHRYPDDDPANTSTPNGSVKYDTGKEYALWCGQIGREHDGQLLSENGHLNTIWALVASIMPVGCVIIVWAVKYLLHQFGHKPTLLLSNTIGILAAILCGLSKHAGSYELLIFGRVLLGMNVGLGIAVVPLYMAEISPAELRGAVSEIPGLFMVTGMLMGIIFILPQMFGTADLWPTLHFLLLVPFCFLFLTLPFFPEGPRYLLAKKADFESARKSLMWLRGSKDVNKEVLALQREVEKLVQGSAPSLKSLFTDNITRSALLVCAAMLLGQQLSGINAVILYSNAIFLNAGLDVANAQYATVGLFGFQILAVAASIYLADRAGRKLLLLFGLTGCTLANIGMLAFMTLGKQHVSYQWAQYASIVCVMLFVIAYNLGPAFVPWVLVSEMFDQQSVPLAMTLCSSVSHVAGVVVALVFPLLQAQIDQWVFAGFAALSGLFAIFTHFKVIETKGRTLEEVQVEMRELSRSD